MLKLKVIKNKPLRLKVGIEFPKIVPGNFQEKTVVPKKKQIVVEADTSYDALKKVIVEPIPEEYVVPEGTLEISANGTYNVENYSETNVNVGGVLKGLVINEYDNDGYPKDISIVGFTKIPAYYLYNCGYKYSSSVGSLLSRITTGFHMPDNITEIGENAFNNFASLEIEELPNSITTIHNNAFMSCKNILLKKLPDNLRTIGQSTFNGCSKIVLTELPEQVTNIGQFAFSGCSELALTKLPEKIIEIVDYAFYNCKKITIKEIPASLRSISSNVFSGCTGITEMTILHNNPQFYNQCFLNCTNLSKLIIPNITSSPYITNSNALQGTAIANKNGYIYVPDNLVNTIKSATNWSAYADQIKGISELMEG